jgi:hypothetical protein
MTEERAADLDVDMIARRIVMHRKLWDEFVSLADVMTKKKGVLVTPSDVAVLAIEAGLVVMRKEIQPAAAPGGHRKPKHGK